MNQYKEIPILFSPDMVQAILAGRKTQTRRMVKPQPIDNTEIDGNFFEGNHKGYVKVDGHPDWQRQFAAEFAKWKVGDVLWVRERFYAGYVLNENDNIPDNSQINYWFFADTRDARPADMSDSHCYHLFGSDKSIWPSWKPSIHMPKDAARIWLRVKSVRVERLQDITEADAYQEGVKESDLGFYRDYLMGNNTSCDTAKESFESLWQAINGNWHHNPWVWVIEFEVLSTTGKPNNI